jgi:NitT/TauT family transport system substrate-binding protein
MHSWSRRLCLVASIIFAVILSACGGSTASSGSSGSGKIPLKIMVGGLSKQIYLPNMLTQQLGFFSQQGLDVTLIDEGSGQSAEDEVLAGQVDAGSGSYNHTQELQAAGKDMESVVQLGLAPGESEMVSAKEAGQIHSMKDLKGKNLGVTELGSGTQVLTEALLVKAGISPSSVHFIPVGAGSTFIAAMQQGRIDAGMTTEPTVTQLETSGVGKMLVDMRTLQTTEAALGTSYPFICVFMRNDYVNNHKDVVQKLVNAYVETLKWIHTHTAAQIADKMPPDYYAGDKPGYITALQNQLGMFSPDGLMPADGPQAVLNIEYQTSQIQQGKQITIPMTYTNEFVQSAQSLNPNS